MVIVVQHHDVFHVTGLVQRHQQADAARHTSLVSAPLML